MKIFRTLVITSILVLGSMCLVNAQSFSLGVSQDVRLATSKDDHGNSPFTLDGIISLDLNGKQWGQFVPALRLQYEYADLSGGAFSKYDIGAAITWNQIKGIPKLEMGLSAGYGVIARNIPNTGDTGSVSFSGDIAYMLFGPVGLYSKFTMMDRSDIGTGLQPNWSFGFKYNF